VRRLTRGGHNIALVQFPGSNCDVDMVDAFKRHYGLDLNLVWHTETQLPKVEGVILPGGFSYGDYLRSGALASHSPIMAAVKSFAKGGGPVMGICNGFQILTESHLLPGALLRNTHRKFVCKYVTLASGEGHSVFHQGIKGQTLKVPVAHGEGRYFIDPEGLKRLQGQGQVFVRYVDESGKPAVSANPNGATDNIAGIISENGRVMGMMPHPERATDQVMGGSADGLPILEAFLSLLG
jgi:phosphoribosylformylglycinamidine synthase subunit PurQ / glutaminase